mmetsp:Transcript_18022/g.45079  ORF Transcript_18022/g.45079 Transcript_18022/m.45079 type:complete len:386 (-) Transcript_18022:563-1720(-)|eukprot:CAMPEP_0178990974 /NCGR_PEP_ID=MMETSP0795-20121207/5262_1 /TAXON_ID=88552 /ORGANISM="Amoebophrya sp., Strain Ameob2" /LENGTH=385 /DNA_ID=CAMNT_0020682615 /DNA_START=235 /DNA_END=1392 /DNA_ORIENTATION=-
MAEVGAEIFLDATELRRHVFMVRRRASKKKHDLAVLSCGREIGPPSKGDSRRDLLQANPGCHRVKVAPGSLCFTRRQAGVGGTAGKVVELEGPEHTPCREEITPGTPPAAKSSTEPNAVDAKRKPNKSPPASTSASADQLASYPSAVYHFLFVVNSRYFTTWTLLVLFLHLSFASFLDQYARAIRATILHVSMVAGVFVWVHPRKLLVDGRVLVQGGIFRLLDVFVHHAPCLLYLIWYHREVVEACGSGEAKAGLIDFNVPGNNDVLLVEEQGSFGSAAEQLMLPYTSLASLVAKTVSDVYGWGEVLPGLYTFLPSSWWDFESGSAPRLDPEAALQVATTSPLWNFPFYALYRVYLRYIAKIDPRELYGVEFHVLWVCYFIALWL